MDSIESILAQNVTFSKSSIPKDLLEYFEPAECGACYVCKLVDVFREMRRVLHPSGTVWLNLGDSYASSSKGSGGPSEKQLSNAGSRYEPRKINHGVKDKDLLGIPWEVAFALRADGWWLRSEIIWHKRAPMPESVTDRPTKAHEQVFLLAKSASYYYDHIAIAEPAQGDGRKRGGYVHGPRVGQHVEAHEDTSTRNKRSVWTLGPEQFAGAHFAVMPTKLVEPCILAGSSAHGCCAACGSPWERDKPGEKWYNTSHENIYLPPVSEKSIGRVVPSGQSEKGRSASLVSGMLQGTGESQAARESRESQGTGKNPEGTAQREDSRTQAPIPGDRTRQSSNEGKEAGVQPDREGQKESTKKAQEREPNGTRQDQRSDSLQSPTGVAYERTGSLYGSGLDGDIGEAESSLPILQSPIHHGTTRNNRPRNSSVEGRGTQPREYSGSVPPMQFPQVESPQSRVTDSWHPTCTCQADAVPCTILDPFVGSGTVGFVSLRHGRNFVGIDLNADYLELARTRIEQSQPMLFSAGVDA